MYDTVFRFDDEQAMALAFPCEETPRPPSWVVQKYFDIIDEETQTVMGQKTVEITVLGPQEVTPPYTETVDEETGVATRNYLYDPTGIISEGVWCTVSTKEFSDDIWNMPEAVCWRNRITEEIVNRGSNTVDLPVRISPPWSGMPGDFILPPRSE